MIVLAVCVLVAGLLATVAELVTRRKVRRYHHATPPPIPAPRVEQSINDWQAWERELSSTP